MKCIKTCIILLVVYVTSGQCKLKRPPPTRPALLPRAPDFRLPPDLRLKDMPDLRVPNSKFCDERSLQPAQHYVVLPWWYIYCHELRLRKESKYSGAVSNLQFYKDVLHRINESKKKMVDRLIL